MASFLVLFSADEIGGIPVTYPRPPTTHLVLSAIKKVDRSKHSHIPTPNIRQTTDSIKRMDCVMRLLLLIELSLSLAM